MRFCLSLFLLLVSPAVLAQQKIINPVLDQDFPDPTVIRAEGKYFAYATNSRVDGAFYHIQVATSSDLQHWKIIGDALPQKPSWAGSDFWAPHVLYDAVLKEYVLFYSGESNDKNEGKCLGVAFSDKPEGPFIDKGTPLLCGEGFINIDPFAFIDPESGKKLLYWGSDFKPIKVQELTADWADFKPGTTPKAVVWPDKEKNYTRLIEGAWVDYHQGKYYLFYSGDNCCGAEANYAVMVACSDNAMGPFITLGEEKRTGSSVILEKNARWLAPGHNSLFKDEQGNEYIAYHAIYQDPDKRNGRVFCISPIKYENGWPVITGEKAPVSKVDWGQTVVVHNEPVSATAKKQGGRALYGSQYGRMLELDNGNWLAAYTVSRNAGYQKDPDGGYAIEIAVSKDQGLHWKAIGLVSEKGRDVDNAALIQLPDGTVLLGCRSVRWQESYRLPVYRSSDNGHHWTKVSTIDVNEGKPGELGHPDKGIYEPHFYFLADGRLAVMYANEKHVVDSPSYSQIISQKISPDSGKSWGKENWVAYQPGHPDSRPGMPVWTRMKNGKYIVVYEICGPEKCNIYSKTSDNGIAWPAGLGKLIPDQNGAPYLLALKDGRLIVTSNKGNISVSEDGGLSWQTTTGPWHPKKSYAEDWTQTIWSALYQMGPGEIGMISSVKREEGGHNIQLRFGKITP